ncbi:MAG: MBL fold metallo-hydrolase [Chloroflexi bacterium]|nr:MBL fold metallo-hydrolase [Chloroflexota bacterium]
MFQIGAFTCYLINDARILVDAGGPFGLVPRPLWRDMMPPDAENRVPMTHHNLLVQTGDRTLLIDTGYGSKLTDKQRAQLFLEQPGGGLIGGLGRLGLTVADIDLVINTHLHGDHCGGNTTLGDDGGTIAPTFPNAEYVAQRREYEDAMHPNERTRATYIPANYAPLVTNGQMRLLDGDAELVPGVRGVITPGHTPAHMSIVLESEGQTAAFVCDLASYAIHFERLGWMTAYDVEPLITLETKRVWQQWALETNALLIFPHDPVRPLGRLIETEAGKLRIDPVAEPFV